jgi:hypothetical protein
MRLGRTAQLNRAQCAADELVAALREHDVEGVALRRANAVARLLRAWLTRNEPGNLDVLSRAVGHVRVMCAVRRLHEIAPVRRALTAFTVAAERSREF